MSQAMSSSNGSSIVEDDRLPSWAPVAIVAGSAGACVLLTLVIIVAICLRKRCVR